MSGQRSTGKTNIIQNKLKERAVEHKSLPSILRIQDGRTNTQRWSCIVLRRIW